MRHKAIQIRDLSPSAYVLRLERKDFIFKPGQCVNLGLKGSGVNREYSTYSGIDDPYLEFLIKDVKGGSVSSALRKIPVGDEVDLHGPYGSFAIDEDKIRSNHYVFIGTGTGIAPFHSFVRSYPDLSYELICGVRMVDERYDYKDYNESQVTFCVSRESWEGFNGRVTDFLKSRPVDPECVYYLCGNQKMISEVYDFIRGKGAPGNNIFTEAFF